MDRQSWWQTISLIITMLGIGAFIWLNVPTNNDIRDLKNEIQNLKNELKKYPTREEMDARFDKLEVLFNTGFSNLENVTTIYRDEVKNHERQSSGAYSKLRCSRGQAEQALTDADSQENRLRMAIKRPNYTLRC